MPSTFNTTPVIAENRHTLVTGTPGSGKSFGNIADILDEIEKPRLIDVDVTACRPAIIGIDLHGKTVFDLQSHIEAMGLSDLVDYDPLHQTRNVLGWPFTPFYENKSDPLKQKMINSQTVRMLMAFLMSRRMVATLADKSVTEEGTHLCLSVMLGQTCPFSMAPWLCYRFTPQYWYLVNHAKDGEAVAKLRAAERLSEKDYEFKMGPARRLLEGVCRSPVLGPLGLVYRASSREPQPLQTERTRRDPPPRQLRVQEGRQEEARASRVSLWSPTSRQHDP
jgi:hypothetical protein